MWKEKLGSRATYQKLIDTFENAGYPVYADIVRTVESEMDSPKGYAEPVLQPEPYLQPKPGPLSSPKLTRQLSPCDEFLEINSADAKDLPEGENYYSVTSDSYLHTYNKIDGFNILGDIYCQSVLESYNVSIVPSLSSKKPEVNKVNNCMSVESAWSQE